MPLPARCLPRLLGLRPEAIRRTPRHPPPPVDDLLVPDCHLGFYPSLVRVSSRPARNLGGGHRTRCRGRSHRGTGPTAARRLAIPAHPGPRPVLPALQHRNPRRRRPDLASDFEPRPWTAPGSSPPWNGPLPTSAPATSTRSTSPGVSTCPAPRIPGSPSQRLLSVSPAPFAAVLRLRGVLGRLLVAGIVLLHLSGRHLTTRPIKGTRPRSADPDPRRTTRLGTAAQRPRRTPNSS
jgi:hypothetical protein